MLPAFPKTFLTCLLYDGILKVCIFPGFLCPLILGIAAIPHWGTMSLHKVLDLSIQIYPLCLESKCSDVGWSSRKF
jgi:hypothetical protein